MTKQPAKETVEFITPVAKEQRDFKELVHYVSIGAYKRSDAYGRKGGLGRLSGDDLGPQFIIFHPNKKKINVYWTVDEGIEKLRELRK